MAVTATASGSSKTDEKTEKENGFLLCFSLPSIHPEFSHFKVLK